MKRRARSREGLGVCRGSLLTVLPGLAPSSSQYLARSCEDALGHVVFAALSMIRLENGPSWRDILVILVIHANAKLVGVAASVSNAGMITL
jgi:cyanate permease